MLYGGWARGSDLAAPAVREHVLGLVEHHWGLGSGVLTEIFAPEASPGLRASIAAYQCAAAPATTARALLAAAYAIDVTAALPHITARTTVLHREHDRAAPVDQGRVLAAEIPGATFVLLPGRSHLPYVGDLDGVVDRMRAALGLPACRSAALPPLTPRQLRSPLSSRTAGPTVRSANDSSSPSGPPNPTWSGSGSALAFVPGPRSLRGSSRTPPPDPTNKCGSSTADLRP